MAPDSTATAPRIRRGEFCTRMSDPRFLIPLSLALFLGLLWAGLWLTRAPALEPEDYLLLTRDSLVKVEAAAMAGDLSKRPGRSLSAGQRSRGEECDEGRVLVREDRQPR